MPQSLSRIILHIVFSTKYRGNLIPREKLPQLHAYTATLFRTNGAEAYRVGGTENHIHIACSLPRTITVANLMRRVKSSSSSWMKKEVAHFQWQNGYGAFSISPTHLPALLSYIDSQMEHHGRNVSFKNELRGLCKKYDVTYEEAYMWD